jgi:hypothetical protein
MEHISKHAHACAALCARELMKLKHLNKRPLVELYGSWPGLEDKKSANLNEEEEDEDENDDKWSYEALRLFQGPVVTFNVKRPNGSLVGYAEVEKMASLNEPPIQLRTGCFCNPGACQVRSKVSIFSCYI